MSKKDTTNLWRKYRVLEITGLVSVSVSLGMSLANEVNPFWLYYLEPTLWVGGILLSFVSYYYLNKYRAIKGKGV